MQIYGIGTDIVQIQRIDKMWQEHGDTFARKILSNNELEELAKQKVKQVAFLAKRFAAKEAVAKALGTGFRDDVIITQIEVIADDLGKPTVSFIGSTKEYVSTLDLNTINLSLSDEHDYVVAFVIITKE